MSVWLWWVWGDGALPADSKDMSSPCTTQVKPGQQAQQAHML